MNGCAGDARRAAQARRTGRAARRRSVPALSRVSRALRSALRAGRQDRIDHLDRSRAPSSAVDTPVSGRQRPRRAADVACHAAGSARYRRGLVGGRGLARRVRLQGRTSPNAICPAATIWMAAAISARKRWSSAIFPRDLIDQVNFMESLVQPDRLRARILLWAEEEIASRTSCRRKREMCSKRALPWRAAAGEAAGHARAHTAPCPAHRLGAPSNAAYLLREARAIRCGWPSRRPGLALDAGIVSGTGF